MKIAEPLPARVLLEEDLWALEDLANLLIKYSHEQPMDHLHFYDITKAAFLSIAKTLKGRVNEYNFDYDGEKYVIMAKGRRRLRLGFKREPDLYIGSEYGKNFVEACHFFFMIHSRGNNFNEKNLTYYGRALFGLHAKDVSEYSTGIKTTSKGHSVWFKIFNQTFTLVSEETKDNAELQCKMLNRTFDNLMTLKKTKPQKSKPL